VNELSQLLGLPESEKARRGLVHTPSEIAQQPHSWISTFESFRTKQNEVREFLRDSGISEKPAADTIVYLVGAGSSDYVGHALVYLLRQLWRCEVVAVPSTDLLTRMDDLIVPGRKYLWISFSRSGDSSEGVAVLAKAIERYPSVRHLLVSCNGRGRMVHDNTGRPQVLPLVLSDAVNDRGLAMTSSFSNMVILGHCLAHAYDLAAYESMLAKLSAAAKDFLPRAADCAAALAKLEFKKAFFVGSGPLRSVAKESALKVLELTAGKTLAMSESALGLRHGPMAALDAESLFVCFLSGEMRAQPYERDLLREIGAKKIARRRVVVSGTEFSPDSFADAYLAPAEGTGVADEYRAPLDVIFGQLLGLFSSIAWNLQPDSPSPGGVINRVVQNLSIH
jgi:tagatose-6-phosphate ketose/aldose isomerase